MSIIRRILIVVTAVAALVAGASPAEAVPSGTAQRKALVVYVTWPSGNGSPAAPADKSLLQVTSAVGTTARNWYKAVSHGYFPGWTARGVGPITIKPPRNACEDPFSGDVMAAAKAAARARGINPDAYNTTVVYFSKVLTCGWAGLSDGKDVWLNGTLSKGTVVQELGHTLQLGHGLALRCTDANGQYVALSSKCTIVKYGDPFNAMGSGEGSFSGIQQDDVGWLSGRLQTSRSDVTLYRLAPLETDPVALQVLKVPDGDGTLWIEYRRAIGVDASMPAGSAGVLIRRQMPGYGRKSILLDMHPGGAFWDAALRPGETFTSPTSKVRVTVENATDTGATIDVKQPAAQKVPNVVDQSESQAKSTLQAHGYVANTLRQVDDSSCDQVGLVMRQSPAGGTTLASGSTVSIYVGKPPSTGCAL